MKQFKIVVLVSMIFLLGCNKSEPTPNNSGKTLSYPTHQGYKQELTTSKDWVSAWST